MRNEVAAHEKEVVNHTRETSAGALEQMYKDLRDELREAKEDNDEEEVQRIKDELDGIKKLRVDLVSQFKT